MSLFEDKKELTRAKLREEFGRKGPSYVRRVEGKRFYHREREGVVDRVFGREYGSHISEEDVQSAIGKLEGQLRDSSLGKEERERANRDLRFLEQRMK